MQRALAEMATKPRGRSWCSSFRRPKTSSAREAILAGRWRWPRFLSSRELSVAKTVAYIPKTIKGHAVLVAMACEEIVMAPDAEIGEAGIDEPAEEPIDPTVRSGYQEIANRRKTIPAQVALGMLDKNVEVLKVETEVSPEFVLRSELEEFKKTHTIQSEKVLNRAGQLAHFRAVRPANWDL